MKIKDGFKLIQGHQITDEEIYHSMGNIPVLTGRNVIKGYWDKKIIDEAELPCITYPTKGNSGQVYVQYQIFDANNTAILILFDEWKSKINLEWMAFKLTNYFLDIQTSKEGVSYLNKEIVEELDIEIPDKKIQDKQYAVIKSVLEKKDRLNSIISKIDKVLEKSIVT